MYVYDPSTDMVIDGVEGGGPAILAVDNLPCELPLESSEYFSRVLSDFIPGLARCDFSRDTENLELPPPLRRSLILHRGKFTQSFNYMKNFIE